MLISVYYTQFCLKTIDLVTLDQFQLTLLTRPFHLILWYLHNIPYVTKNSIKCIHAFDKIDKGIINYTYNMVTIKLKWETSPSS